MKLGGYLYRRLEVMFDFLKKRKEVNVKGHLDSYDGHTLRGWAATKDGGQRSLISISINGKHLCIFLSDKFREDLKAAGIQNGYASFYEKLSAIDIAKEYGPNCTLRLCHTESGKELDGSPIYIGEPQLKWNVQKFTSEVCKGWIIDENNTYNNIRLKVYIEDELVSEITANLENQDINTEKRCSANHGFHINLAELSVGKSAYKVRIEAEYDNLYEIAAEKEFVSFQKKLKCLTDLQIYLRKQGYGETNTENNRLVQSIIPGLIDSCRENIEVPEANISQQSDSCDIKDSIAVIVPVYKGIKETLNCLKSVLNSKNKQTYRLITINDCSPEEEMQPALQTLADGAHFELLLNENNLGFVGTVNRGMKLSRGHDVILLNSDTVVADGWLDAIIDAASFSEQIATVTPISNNATICSFPNFCADNELPEGYDVHKLAGLCSTNKSPPVELPTAHGYCMFIKRKALNEVGYFDEQTWGKGYGEENDFSLRATRLGWKHVATNKTFVQHLGSVSFSEDAAGFMRENLEKLNSLYPDYPRLIQEFVLNDPMRLLRNELAQKLLIRESQDAYVTPPAKGKSILFVSLSFGGGTKKASEDLAKNLLKAGQSVLLLTTSDNKIWTVSSYKSNVAVYFDMSEEAPEFFLFLQQLDIWTVHYQHWLEFGEEIWELPEKLACSYRVTLHDYYAICPRVEFITFDNKYCENESQRDCNSCLESLGVYSSSYVEFKDFGSSIELWRKNSYEKLMLAEQVIVPSQDTKQRIESYIPLTNIKSISHSEDEIEFRIARKATNKGEKIKIGFVGAIGIQKGLDVLKGIVQEISTKELNIEIIVIGYTSDDGYFEPFDFVSIKGVYSPDDLNEMLKVADVDVVFLSSITPETFGFTYAEVLSQGIPLVAFDLGAITERIEPGSTHLLRLGMSVEEILSEIEEFLAVDIYISGVVGKKQMSSLEGYYS
jgi:GT2 family glycosyltransferase/glycosyltransferase involved in cell wall biosynthesis